LSFLKQEAMAVGARFTHHHHLTTSGNKGKEPTKQKGKQPLVHYKGND